MTDETPSSRDSILANLRSAKDKGSLLELVLEDVLLDRGFAAVRRQASGSQYGYDLIAVNKVGEGRSETWLFECKNLARRVTVHDIAPKLVWHLSRAKIDHFVIVSPADVTNEVERLLAAHPFSMPISTWTGRVLEAMILDSPRARARLGVAATTARPSSVSPLTFPPREPAALHVAPQTWRSAADYFLVDGELVKADTQLDLAGLITNRTDELFAVYQLFAVTEMYRTVSGRVLRQLTPRALRTPEKLFFSLKPQPGSRVEMLKGQVWEIHARSTDTIAFRLTGDVSPGFYVVSFEARGVLSGRQVTLSSIRHYFHAPAPQADLLRIEVFDGFCETPSKRLLQGSEEEWQMLKREAASHLQLGPTPMQRNRAPDSTWLVRVARPAGEPARHGDFILTPTRDEVLLDLEIPFDPAEQDDSRRTLAH